MDQTVGPVPTGRFITWPVGTGPTNLRKQILEMLYGAQLQNFRCVLVHSVELNDLITQGTGCRSHLNIRDLCKILLCLLFSTTRFEKVVDG